MTKYDLINDRYILEHGGVKGMKWGIRKKRPSKDDRLLYNTFAYGRQGDIKKLHKKVTTLNDKDYNRYMKKIIRNQRLTESLRNVNRRRGILSTIGNEIGKEVVGRTTRDLTKQGINFLYKKVSKYTKK